VCEEQKKYVAGLRTMEGNFGRGSGSQRAVIQEEEKEEGEGRC
jgi:hypothetical protein